MSLFLRQSSRILTRPTCRYSVRQFSRTSTRQDLFDFLKKRSIKPRDAQKEKPQEAVTETTNTSVEETNKEKPKPNKREALRVIGKPPSIHESWETEKNGFDLSNPWPTKLNNSELSIEQVENALLKNYTEIIQPTLNTSVEDWMKTELNDLKLRFDYTKAVISQLNVSIPDRVLSEMNQISDLYDYYVDNVVGKIVNEKLPDAIYFDPNEFEGTNITFVDADKEKKDSKQRWKNLVKQAKDKQRQRQRELLDKALE